jgi:hypothetical protein
MAYLILILSIAFAAAPIFSAPFTGYDPSAFPVLIARNFIQPAGWAFSIWGLIYGWLILHAVFGVLKRRHDPDWTATRLPLSVALAVGTAWLALALFDPFTATIAILIMAAAATAALLRADTQTDRWLLSAPVALFAGWLTAASGVSLGVMIAGYGLLTNTATALVILMAVLAFAAWVQSRKPGQPLYSAAVAWALIGVAGANGAEVPVVTSAALIGAAALAALAWRRVSQPFRT